ncbi:MAG: helix-hairpin-helix domain-containing protein [Saprospiraceae bacterium]|nr:helix-hairpin-helix domain-containing protein [Saprospiraceae bacterium]
MDFSKFFSNFDSPDSIAILFFLILAFLFGLLVGYLLRGGAVRRLKRELEKKQKELTTARAEIPRLEEELHLREADLRKVQFEGEENKTKVARLADEKTKLYNEVYALNTELENLRKSGAGADTSQEVTELNVTIDRLNAQIKALQLRNQQLENELKDLKSVVPDEKEEAVDYLAQFQSTQNALRSRLEALEAKLNKVETENANLKGALQDIKTTNSVAPVVFETSTPRSVVDEVREPVFTIGTNKAILMDPLLQQKHGHDNLTRIEGISPFLEKKLNEAGVYTYEQISQWDSADINRIIQAIGYLPGRIEKEDWIGQAIKLQKQQKTQPESFETRGFGYPTQNDDLKIIEGIGPKIEGLLKNAGIHTWEELSETDAERLREILNQAGESYRIHDPTTWPAQARLAANGSWELLREYQDQLKGGRELH